MTVVLDANILIAFALADEPLHNQARQLLLFWKTNQEHLVAPRLFRSEIAAVVRKVVFQKRIDAANGHDILVQLLRYPITFYDEDSLLIEAYELAVRFNHPRAYDTQYLALAEQLQCDFWTADERLTKSVQSSFTHVRWLGNWMPPT
jgi:predicted nucleic acid-binding protein